MLTACALVQGGSSLLLLAKAPSQWTKKRRASLANVTQVCRSSPVTSGTSWALHNLSLHDKARQPPHNLHQCLGTAAASAPHPDSGAAGLLTLHATLELMQTLDAAGPSMPVSPGMPSPQRRSAKGTLSSSPRRQQRVPVPGSAAWPPRSPLSTQCPNGVQRSLSKPTGTSIGATRAQTASENIVSNP